MAKALEAVLWKETLDWKTRPNSLLKTTFILLNNQD